MLKFAAAMSIIEPINNQQKAQVITVTAEYIQRAEDLFNRKFSIIPVHFDLKGKACGMYCTRGFSKFIRYNPYIFAKYFDENLAGTVPHEVAHYVVDKVYGRRRAKPHGPEWQAVMAEFGADASRTSDFNLEGIPVKSHQQFAYRCDCNTHQISSRRHNKVLKGRMQYRCLRCQAVIVPVE